MRDKGIIFALAAIIALFALYAGLQIFVPVRLSEPREVRITKGMSFTEAANALEKEGLIKDRVVFIALGRLSGLDKKLKAGYYSFRGNVSGWYVFKAMLKGYIVESAVTIVEGDSLPEIKKKLASVGAVAEEEFERLSIDKDVLSAFAINAPSLEGYLFPDTYIIPKGLEPEEVIAMMVRRLRDEYGEKLRARAGAIGMDENEVLALASIIEKEAIKDFERPIISAVYHNRLAMRMPLQADPTCVYGVKPMSEGVKRADLKRKTPYNTYIIKGLPPGPIASPGLKSIEAALYPADVPYLYFVSNRDGTHTFSSTLSDHQRAIEFVRSKKLTEQTEITNSNGI